MKGCKISNRGKQFTQEVISVKPKKILTNSRRLRNTDDHCCRVEEVSFSVHVEKLWNRIIDYKSILPEIHEVDVEKSSSRATMDHKYCRKFSQLNLSKIQINYSLKESDCFFLGVKNVWFGSRMLD